jgi:hypothetical protein
LGWSSDPGADASFLFHFSDYRSRFVWLLGWSRDPDADASFLFHFGPHMTDPALIQPRRSANARWHGNFLGIFP